MVTTIEQNQNKILKFMHDSEEAKGIRINIDAKSIQRATGLTPYQISTALNLLKSKKLVIAFEGSGEDGYEFSSAMITANGKVRAEMSAEKKTIEHSKNPRNVFVVHGRDLGMRDALFEFLRAIDLHPLEWTELIQATGKGAPYVGEVLDKAFREAQAVVVLMTPDDEGCLRASLRGSTEPPYEKELTPQARLNVVFEAGIAMGHCPERTILVEIGNLRPFSDIAGRHSVRMDNKPEKRLDLAQRLESAGCLTNRKGSEWLKAGDFSKKVNDGKNEQTFMI